MKASVTRKTTAITQLMCTVENVDEVIAAEKILDEAMERFRWVNENYHQVLSRFEAKQASVQYLNNQLIK